MDSSIHLRRILKLMETMKPIYADLKDKGKTDPYHRELTPAEWEELAKLKAALDAQNEARVQILNVRDSSTIEILTYCEDTSVMTITFKSGSSYAYDGVSKSAWDKFSVAGSKGRHFAREIKPRYTGRKL